MPLVVLAVFLSGLLFYFTNTLMNAGLSAEDVGAIREIPAATVMGILLLVFRRDSFKVKLRDIPMFIVFATFNTGSNIVIFSAMSYIPLGMASVVEMTSPYFVLVFSSILFGMKITRIKLLACMVTFLGCVLTVGVITNPGNIRIEGVLLALSSAIFLAGFTIGGRYAGNRGYSEEGALFYFFLFSGLMFIPLADYGNIYNVLSSDTVLVADSILMILLCTVLVNFLIIYITRRMEPGIFAIFFASSVIVTTTIGILAFDETITVYGVLGVILVIVGNAILESDSVRRSLKERKERQDEEQPGP